ncbi:MAG: SDR family oxidoreductase [Chloroflexota bacterium]
MADSQLILVTGATGYVGGRLVPRLLAAGYRVRCLARDPARLAGRAWSDAEIVAGDVLTPATLPPALAGVHTAYYLVHSMAEGEEGFAARDRDAAANFAQAAAAAGVQRIIYLGGLGQGGQGGQGSLSHHLRSRQEVGDVLRQGQVPVTEFRAAVVVGAGSMSFEMIRYLTERVPVMITPSWVKTPCQPIAIRDLLSYLLACLQAPRSVGQVIEIGGADVITYGEMMLTYARVRGLRRVLLSVPVLTPRLSSHWVGLVTPIPAAYARPLIEGLRNPVVVHDRSAEELFPAIKPMSYEAAVLLAVQRITLHQVETSWTSSLSATPYVNPVGTTLESVEGMLVERRVAEVKADAPTVYRVFSGIGGRRGWLYANWTWRLRGIADRLIGGVGMRRGRRDPNTVVPGDALDWWRVEAVQPDSLLRLRAEMKLPGRGWLEFCVEPQGDGTARLSQTAYFQPTGLTGVLYWYGLYPIHRLIFRGMLAALVRRAESLKAKRDSQMSTAAGIL